MDEKKPFLTFVDPVAVPEREPETTQTKNTASTAPEPAPVTGSHIRTYHQDLNKVMGSNDPRTMSDILQNVRRDEAVKESKSLVSGKNKLFLVGSILCILIGIGALLFVLYRNYTTDQTLQNAQRQSLISAETNTNVTLVDGETFKNRDRIRTAFQTAIPLETINNIFFTKETVAGLIRVPFAGVVAETGGAVPAGLAAVLDGNFMYGTYRSNDTLPFLILRVTNYDDAFDGMQAWEPLMVNQLGFLFSLPESLQSDLSKAAFENKIIANRNVRAVSYKTPVSYQEENQAIVPTPAIESETLVLPETASETSDTIPTPEVQTESASEVLADTQPLPEIEPLPEPVVDTPTIEPPYQEGEVILLYTFLNEKTILITTSESVMREILIRLTNAQLLF